MIQERIKALIANDGLGRCLMGTTHAALWEAGDGFVEFS